MSFNVWHLLKKLRKLHGKSTECRSNQGDQIKVAYNSFPKKKDLDFESVKFKQQDVFSEVLDTAINAKCNFT